jgi:PAS domain S-box-containing protein
MPAGPKAATSPLMRHEEEERMRLLVESIRDYAVFLLDSGGHVRSWNNGAQIIKGYRADEIIGKHISTFYTPAERDGGKPGRLLGIAVRDGRVEDEGWRVRKDGSRFWADVVITALRSPGPDGDVIGFVKVTRDLTDRLRAQEERLRLAHAEEAIRLRDEFLSIASHELRTPLTALQLQLESLEEAASGSSSKVMNKVTGAVRSTQRLGVLIDSLLDVSRIATGQLDLHPEAMDLGASTILLLDGLRDAAERSGSQLTFVAPEQAVRGEWDRVRIDQLLMNLVANAIKYGAGRPVEVTLHQEDSFAVLTVRDHGPGISPEDMKRIFERFERATSMRNYGGFGLGLYVAREVARAHGGSIDVQNLADGGACFTVRLPLVTPARNSEKDA